MESRPQFVQAWTSFRAVYGDGTLNHVAEAIGGKVKSNIDSGVFENACAIRISYVLNNSGIPIGAGGASSVSGADGRRYIYRVKDLAPSTETRLGKPDTYTAKPDPKLLKGRKGILMFDVGGWSNATVTPPCGMEARVSTSAILTKRSACSFGSFGEAGRRVFFYCAACLAPLVQPIRSAPSRNCCAVTRSPSASPKPTRIPAPQKMPGPLRQAIWSSAASMSMPTLRRSSSLTKRCNVNIAEKTASLYTS